MALDRGGDSLRKMIILTNGPRVTWDRMPSLALDFFILFKSTLQQTLERDLSHIIMEVVNVDIIDAVLSLITTSWMLSEQIIFSRQIRANENGADEETYVDWTITRRLKQKGAIKYLTTQTWNEKFQGNYFRLSFFLRYSGYPPLP